MDLLKSVAAALLVMAWAGTADAQLSPGKLAAVHADIEGVANCARCHSSEQGVAADRCLECHAPLRARIRAGRGLHARPEYAACGSCHVEHQGRDYALIFWKGGERSFDHALTGRALKGKHAALTCRECHRAELVKDAAVRAAPKLDPGRTYLGLGADCADCHRDPHAGDLGPRCADCHDENRWKPAPGFRHARTRYPLEGAHLRVDCVKCHRAAGAAGGTRAGAPVESRFRGLAFAACSDCHDDPHRGRFRESCASCHTTAGWREVNASRLDHDRTRYPLRGRHLSVACVKCHPPGRPMTGLRFQACGDCHRGYRHQARFLTTADQGACEGCHVVDGFSPATYPFARHATSRYPLEGAHQAVACPACHRRNDRAPGPAVTTLRCVDCHRDPHGADLRADATPRGCESCHVTTGWRAVNYDHGLTRFALSGRHQAVACAKCHRPQAAPAIAPNATANSTAAARPATPLPVFSSAPVWCADCHEDIHRGQFQAAIAVGGGAPRTTTDCARCHTTTDWLAERFDHNRDSRYPLEGAHARVRCAGCHPQTREGDISLVRYRSLETTCEGCHGSKNVRGKETP